VCEKDGSLETVFVTEYHRNAVPSDKIHPQSSLHSITATLAVE